MGQKVNPIGFRTGVMIGWKSRWYASKQEFAELLVEDQKIRNFIKNHPQKTQYRNAGIDRIEIERTRDEVKVILFVARPGLIIGKKGQEVELLQEELQNLIGRRVNLKIEEIHRPEIAGPVGGRRHRPAIGQAVQLPPDDEAGDGADDGGRCQGDQDPVGRTSGRVRNGAAREADRRLDSAEHAAGENRLRVCRSQDRPRPYRRPGLDQSGYVRRRRYRWR